MDALTTGVWQTCSFLLEMKPRAGFASLFVACPSSEVEGRLEMVKVDEQLIELDIGRSSSASAAVTESKSTEKENSILRSSKLCDVILDPGSICSASWADPQQKVMMCKIRAEADYVSFSPKNIKKLGEELAHRFHLREYIERIEHAKSFHVKCRCGQILHSHAKNEFEFGLLPSDDWIDMSPQMDYFCALSGSECCAQHLHNRSEGILGISSNFSAESARHWLPGERKIVFSDSFILFLKNEYLTKALNLHKIESLSVQLISCTNCNSSIGTTLRNHPDVFKLHLSVLNVHGENPRKSCYVLSRFQSTECFLAWMLLNKCEHHSSVKLIIRSLDKSPQLLVWLLEPYILLTKGVLQTDAKPSVSFPALKVLYKVFDSNSSKQDPKANGEDSSVGILEVPMGCSLQLTELLLASSLTLPPPLRALGQFYVGFIRLKDRVD